MNKKTLTNQEIDMINTLQDNYAKIIAELGQTEISILLLEKQIESIKKDKKDIIYKNLLSLQEQEKFIIKELNEKYGEGIINLTTKEITLQ